MIVIKIIKKIGLTTQSRPDSYLARFLQKMVVVQELARRMGILQDLAGFLQDKYPNFTIRFK